MRDASELYAYSECVRQKFSSDNVATLPYLSETTQELFGT